MVKNTKIALAVLLAVVPTACGKVLLNAIPDTSTTLSESDKAIVIQNSETQFLTDKSLKTAMIKVVIKDGKVQASGFDEIGFFTATGTIPETVKDDSVITFSQRVYGQKISWSTIPTPSATSTPTPTPTSTATTTPTQSFLTNGLGFYTPGSAQDYSSFDGNFYLESKSSTQVNLVFDPKGSGYKIYDTGASSMNTCSTGISLTDVVNKTPLEKGKKYNLSIADTNCNVKFAFIIDIPQ